MQLAHLVDRVSRVRETAKKTEKVRLLADLLRQTRECETELAALYLTGTLPQGRIGIGWSLIQRAMVEGSAAGEPLTLPDVDRMLATIAADQGTGSTERRVRLLARLFGRATPDERRFLSQLLIGEIRQGALEGHLIDAIARAADLPAAEVRQACMFAPNIGDVARVALEEGRPGLARYALRLFRPVAPMLANSAGDVEEALTRLHHAAFEYKLDGVRIQVHKGGEDVRIFTRQLQDVTERLPEVVAWARRLPAREAVLDGEALGLRSDGRPQPFQITARRLGRSHNVGVLSREIPVSPFAFDALYLDGRSLLTASYEERTRALAAIAPDASVPRLVTADAGDARVFFEQALAMGHEGVMAKQLVGPVRRGAAWHALVETEASDDA